jgi:arsenate reductase (thioredoxin)
MKRVLFVDVRNATRSQIAEAWFNQLASDLGVAQSCGTMPANRTDPRAIQAMREAGLNLRRAMPKMVNQQLIAQSDMVVLMGKDIRPDAFSPTYVWEFQELTGRPIEEVRQLRDQIRNNVQALIAEIRLQDLDEIMTPWQWQIMMESLLLP